MRLTNQPDDADDGSAMESATNSATIAVRDVGKCYSVARETQIEALLKCNLEVSGGEFISIIGPSGCGKSTLLRMIAGLDSPSTGSIAIGESFVSGPRKTTGIVFQKPVLLKWRTVYDNVILPFQVRGGNTVVDYKRRALELLRLVGLSEFADRYPSQLSGGMQQRVAIARALVTNPNVLLMDEPFGALDELTRELMNEELLRIWSATTPTVVFITHSIAEAVYLSDRVVVISGRPGTVKAIVDIPIERPRVNQHRSSPLFFELSGKLRSLLHNAHQ